jgi:Glyoxalase-like domain
MWTDPCLSLSDSAYDRHSQKRFFRSYSSSADRLQLLNEIVIGPDVNAPVGICFMPVTDAKIVKNPVHLDLTTSAVDRDQEIERLLALGARRLTISPGAHAGCIRGWHDGLGSVRQPSRLLASGRLAADV